MLRKILPFILFLFLTPIVKAQPNRVIDSLNTVIKDAKHDTLVALAYWQLTEELFLVNLDTVPYLCKMGEEICVRNLNNHQISKRERWKFLDILGKCLNNQGYVLAELGDYEAAMHHYYDALSIQRAIDDKDDMAWSYNNIGYVFYTQKNWDKCFENYENALELFKETGDEPGIAHMMNNLGLAYKNNGDTVKALEYYRECLIHHELTQNKKGIALVLHNIGHIEMDRGQYVEALAKFQRAHVLYEELNNISGQSSSKRSQAEVFFELGEFATAEEMALLAYDQAVTAGNPRHQSRATELLTRVYNAEGKYEKLWEVHQLFDIISDSLENQAVEKTSVEREMHFEFEKQNAIRDAEHEKELQVSSEREKRQKLFSYGIAVILLLFAVFLYFVYNRLKVSRRQNLIIESQKRLVEVKNKEITDSINYAKRIQQAIVPSDDIIKAQLPQSFVLYIPKDIVAGDFYWLHESQDEVLFAVADCTGHGVPGAMVSVVCNNALNRAVREFGLKQPGQILDKIRVLVEREFEDNERRVNDGMDISLCSYNRTTKTLNWAGANNPLWVVKQGAGDVEEIKANKQPIGYYDKPVPFTNHTVNLEKGDSIYIFSDGFPDQFGGPKGKKYYSARFKSFLVNLAKDPIEDQSAILETEFNRWMGNYEQIDDVCIMGIRI